MVPNIFLEATQHPLSNVYHISFNHKINNGAKGDYPDVLDWGIKKIKCVMFRNVGDAQHAGNVEIRSKFMFGCLTTFIYK